MSPAKLKFLSVALVVCARERDSIAIEEVRLSFFLSLACSKIRSIDLSFEWPECKIQRGSSLLLLCSVDAEQDLCLRGSSGGCWRLFFYRILSRSSLVMAGFILI